MKEYFEGWKERSEVEIPPVRGQGFYENVHIRKAVEPIRKKRPEIYNGEEPTVLVSPETAVHAFIKRIKTGEEHEVDKEEFVIGKSARADFIVTDNPTVSRVHGKISRCDDGYWLEDMGSSNHIFVDGRQIRERIFLTDHMQFQLAQDEIFEFMIRAGR